MGVIVLILRSFDLRAFLVQAFICASVTLLAKTYIKFKPYWDIQKNSKHCNYANWKLFGCDENSTWKKLS